MRSLVPLSLPILALLALPEDLLRGQKSAALTEEEEDKVREVQDPSQRIEVYLDFAQARLERFEGFRTKPADPKYDNAAYLDSILDQYIVLTDELKNWIDYQYQRKGDMRSGLRALLNRGPKQLEVLRHIQQTPDAYAPAYSDSLHDALDDLTDALDGGTKALADQQKTFAQLKRDEKAEARTSKERAKEERKRTKEEKKLRKKEHKRGVPADSDED
jgi:septal ring factor EnvC (AmiA/AmiB activator)